MPVGAFTSEAELARSSCAVPANPASTDPGVQRLLLPLEGAGAGAPARYNRAVKPTPKVEPGWHPRTVIIVAAVAVFVINAWVPFGSTALYPLTLFTTWVHEMGHGLTALAFGGEFRSLEIHSNAGGLAYAYAGHGWPDAMVAAGGLLAPPLVGGLLLAFVHRPRTARIVLGVLAGALVLSVVIWVRSTTGVIAMPLVAAVLGWAAWRGFAENPERRVVLVQMLSVSLGLDTLTRMVSYSFMATTSKGQRSDVSAIADNLGGHYLLWGLAITTIALGMLSLGLWRAWRRPGATGAPRGTSG